MGGRTSFYSNVGPRFAVNPASLVWDEGHLINWAFLDEKYQEDKVTIKLSAAASVNDTSISVDALAVDIPKGVALQFGAWNAGDTKEFVYTTDKSLAGDTSIAVTAIPTALEDNDEAYWSPGRIGKILRAGTIVTIEGGYIIPRALATVSTLTATTNVTNAQPIALNNFTAHGFLTGDVVRTSGVTTNLGANGIFVFDKVSADAGTLRNSTGTGASGGTLSVVRAAIGVLGTDARENDWSSAKSGHGLIIGGLLYRDLLPEYAETNYATWEEELVYTRGGTLGFAFRDYADSSS